MAHPPVFVQRHWLLCIFSLLSVTAFAVTPVSTNNLDSIISNENLKFVFVGGKGGVGKTTSSSAIASQLSLSISNATKSNRRVLLISTDPAHSLSDAFRMKFSNVPTPIMPDLPNLEVMEVNPAETMKKELALWGDLAKELGYDPDNKEDGEGGIGEKLHSFQEWLSGIPGIDEATALSTAIEHIESGRYDMIVFDTAPTGHTLKLLELPKILQVGLDKLESWQATLWGYWEMIRGMAAGSGSSSGMKEKVGQKLKDYKASIGRVADMITDTTRTRFVVVCIAEYLSISESRRLLGELDRFKVVASHIVVNQLVTDYLEEDELQSLSDYAEHSEGEFGVILSKAWKASKLTSARRNIQTKYLKELKNCPEVKRLPDPEAPALKTNSKASSEPLTVLEVPLLPSEVTGPKAILAFSHHLIGKEIESETSKAVGVEGERSKKARAAEAGTKQKASDDTKASKPAGAGASKKKKKDANMPDLDKQADGILAMIHADPELAKEIEKSPKLRKIIKEVKDNPMSAMQYLSDPEVAPFVQKVIGKLMPGMEGMFGGMGGGAGGGKRRKRKGKKDGLEIDFGAMMGAMGGQGGGGEL